MGTYVPEINELVFPKIKKNMINVPARPINAVSGSDFGKIIYNIPPGSKRDKIVCDEVLSGNIPDFMRNLRPITIVEKGNTVQYFVSPDYLCIGNDSDYLRITLGAMAAKSLCNKLNCSMPTKRMVDDIWKCSDLKLNPSTLGASSSMVYSPALITHNKAIQSQIGDRSFQIIAGIKKDIVIGKPLLFYKNKIGIYGWHYTNGKAIQGPGPNYSHHGINYCDYSQAIRLVSKNILFKDQQYDLFDLLNDNKFCYIISEEAAFDANKIYE